MSQTSYGDAIRSLRPPLMSKNSNLSDRFDKASDILKKRDISKGRDNLVQNRIQPKYKDINNSIRQTKGFHLLQLRGLKQLPKKDENYTTFSKDNENTTYSEKFFQPKFKNLCENNLEPSFGYRQKQKEISEISYQPISHIRQSSKFNLPTPNRQKNTKLDSSYISRSIERCTPENNKKERQSDRMNSIDKINLKIHQLLNCSSEALEQKNILATEKDKKEVFNRTGELSLTHTKKVQFANRQLRDSSNQCTGDRNPRFSVNSFNDTSKILNNSITTGGGRSRNRQDSIFKNRNIDEEIKRLQDKIKKTEQQKKKLNIQSKPWTDAVARPLSTHSKTLQNSTYVFERKNYLNEDVSKQVNQRKSKLDVSIPKPQHVSNISQIKLKQQPNSSTFKQYSFQQKSSQGQRMPMNRFLKQTSVTKSSFIFSEEPSSQQRVQKFQKAETKKLIEFLKNQVLYDQQWRNAKALFAQTSDPSLFKNIQTFLSEKGINMTIEEVKLQIQLSHEEHNPFFSSEESNQSLQHLVAKYIRAEQHWTENIKGRLSRQTLRRQGFTEKKIDLQKKGNLKVEDFVRFLNIETGNFYRNRDVILLYRRITTTQSTTFDEFINTLCSQ